MYSFTLYTIKMWKKYSHSTKLSHCRSSKRYRLYILSSSLTSQHLIFPRHYSNCKAQKMNNIKTGTLVKSETVHFTVKQWHISIPVVAMTHTRLLTCVLVLACSGIVEQSNINWRHTYQLSWPRAYRTGWATIGWRQDVQLPLIPVILKRISLIKILYELSSDRF